MGLVHVSVGDVRMYVVAPTVAVTGHQFKSLGISSAIWLSSVATVNRMIP